jgi:hypothetical protein
VAKSEACRYIILKERLTGASLPHGSQPLLAREIMLKHAAAWHIRLVIRTHLAISCA